MNSNSVKFGYELKNNLSKFLKRYKLLLCLAFSLLSIGFVFGVLTVTKNSSDIELDHLSDSGLIDLIKGDKTGMGLFFTHFISFACCFGLIIVCNLKPWFSVLGWLVLIVRGYFVGFDITILILTFGIAGIFNVVLVIMPCELLIWCVLGVIFALKSHKNKIEKKYGCYNVNYSKLYFMFLICGALFILLRCLLLPLMRVTIIVS